MMRNAIVATLVLSPLMVHAQAKLSAQPQVASAPVLQSSLVQPTGLMLGAAEDRPTAKPGAVRISTGVVAPKLVKTVDIQEDTVNFSKAAGSERDVVVAMVVDETGKPEDLKIVQSAGVGLDENVLSAVKQYRFKPGTVSGQIVAVPVNLHITIKEQGE
jgi:TonB family protein